MGNHISYSETGLAVYYYLENERKEKTKGQSLLFVFFIMKRWSIFFMRFICI